MQFVFDRCLYKYNHTIGCRSMHWFRIQYRLYVYFDKNSVVDALEPRANRCALLVYILSNIYVCVLCIFTFPILCSVLCCFVSFCFWLSFTSFAFVSIKIQYTDKRLSFFVAFVIGIKRPRHKVWCSLFSLCLCYTALDPYACFFLNRIAIGWVLCCCVFVRFFSSALLVQRFFTLPVFVASKLSERTNERAIIRSKECVYAFGCHFTCSFYCIQIKSNVQTYAHQHNKKHNPNHLTTVRMRKTTLPSDRIKLVLTNKSYAQAHTHTHT